MLTFVTQQCRHGRARQHDTGGGRRVVGIGVYGRGVLLSAQRRTSSVHFAVLLLL